MADDLPAPIVVQPVAPSMPPMKTAQPIIYIVVGTFAAACMISLGCFVYMAATGKQDSTIAGYVKDIGLLCFGALGGLLANTRSTEVGQNK